ncbi:MAG: beta-ketoacyl reductase, partial [Bacteroidota bacterium]
ETEELQLPLSLFNKGISYSTINIDHLLKHAPYKINEAIKKVVELRNDQTITNALFNTYNVAELADLNESGIQKGLGSTLVHLNSTELDIQQRYSVTDSISEEKTYVITGGTKGLGLSLAGWLGDKGAKHIALLSRSGAKGIDQPEIVEELKSSGVKVNVYSVDVSQYDSVKATLKKIGDEMPVIGGVIHGAMVLDDAMISDLTYAHYEKVLAPKVNGLLNLHFLLEDEDLDFFINFSSVSSLIGNPGQANYVAANAFTENFSNYRRANGKVSTTFNLGPVSGVGAVARNNEVEKLLSTLGIPTITPEEVFEALDKALATKYDQVGVLKLEWAKASQAFPVLTNDDTYIDLKEHFSSGTGTSNSDDLNNWRANYESLDYGEKVQLIIQTFRNEVAQLLTLPVETVESNMNLNALGLDSILAVELSMNMKEKFGIGIPTVDLIGGLAIEEIARKFAQNEESNEADEQEHNSSIENEASEELLVLIEE